MAKIQILELQVTTVLLDLCSITYFHSIHFVDFLDRTVASNFKHFQFTDQNILIEITKLSNDSCLTTNFKFYSAFVIINKKPGADTFIPKISTSMKFITCYTSFKLSFHMYISAYNFFIWLLIFASGLGISLFLSLYIKHNLPSCKQFSPILFYFSLFTEESFEIPLKLANDFTYISKSFLRV